MTAEQLTAALVEFASRVAQAPAPASITLQPDELEQLTGFEQATKQLNVLHRRGFTRAFIGRHGLVLERAHYEAVCRGQIGTPVAKEVDLSFFGKRK
jgi:hypothetical protein